MSSQPEDFEQLRRLLAVKRHEVPPPGYFEFFPDRVTAQLRREETPHSTWWEWLVAKFDAKPVLVCAYGMAVSSLLLAGFRLSQIFEQEVASAPIPDGGWLASSPGMGLLHGHTSPGEFGGAFEPGSVPVVSRVFGGGSDASRLLFQRPNSLRFQHATFSSAY